ncbi:MAG: SIR2 family protein [Firmicutes bacterium]|nr:SIR2 family protein [Bacillota bacterium]
MESVLVSNQKNEAYQSIQAIFRANPLLVVGTGASCALSEKFGMKALTSELLTKIPWLKKAFPLERDLLQNISNKLESNIDLETALKQVIIPENLLHLIAKITGDFVSKVDREYKLKCYREKVKFPLENLIKLLYDGLPSGRILNIITTNYDCLIEHCCDKFQIPICAGFAGHLRKFYNWQSARKQMECIERVGKKKIIKHLPHVSLFKVHGSIDWFKDGDIFFSDASLMYDEMYDDKSNLLRQVIVPGDTKYFETHKNPYSVIKENANKAIRSANGFIFIGYGFNDVHIEDTIKNEILQNQKPAVIITRDLGYNVRELIKKSPEFWAIHKDGNNTLITHNGEKTLTVVNQNIWQIDEFTKEILGG